MLKGKKFNAFALLLPCIVIKQRNKLPHVLYITFNLLYHIHRTKKSAL